MGAAAPLATHLAFKTWICLLLVPTIGHLQVFHGESHFDCSKPGLLTQGIFTEVELVTNIFTTLKDVMEQILQQCWL